MNKIIKHKIEELISLYSDNLNISEEIQNFISSKITTNVRELEGALNRLSAFSSLVGREISLDMVQDLLKDIEKTKEQGCIDLTKKFMR